MSNVYSRSGIGQPTPVTSADRADQVVNHTGGFVFQIADEARLLRFLILGTTGNTYYQGEADRTREYVDFLRELIARDEQLVIDTVIEVSLSGRAYRNTPAIFAVAALAQYGKIRNLPELVKKVCRTATHLFEFAEYVQLLGGWGRSKRGAVAAWYQDRTPANLAYQAVKYRQRNGWTHRDLMRLTHPVGVDAMVGNFILGKDSRTAAETTSDRDQDIIRGFRFAQEAQSVSELIAMALVPYPNLPWEAIPTQFLTDVRVWRQLFSNGQLRGQALLRNITRLSRIKAFDDMEFAHAYAQLLTDEDMIGQTRLHPLQYLLALKVHDQGQLAVRQYGAGARTKDWQTSSAIMDALNLGFERAFKYVEPANKRTLLAIDVSGSMTYSNTGTELTAAEFAAAMAIIIARTEPVHRIMGFSHEFRDLGISSRMDMTEVMRRTRDNNFGATNIGLPMSWARARDIAIDTFVVLTDNEVNTGLHPYKELQEYRRVTGIPAKLIVVAATPTRFTVADPTDPGMLDVCGADANLPLLVSDFSAGRF